MNGAPVGRELQNYAFKDALSNGKTATPVDGDAHDGSNMIVLATDAPLHPRALDRLAMRAIMGLARTGSSAHNGSGDYVIAFSTHPKVRIPRTSSTPVEVQRLDNASMSPLFSAAAEATQEAIYNAILKAETVSSDRGRLEAISISKLKAILEKYNALHWRRPLSPGQAP